MALMDMLLPMAMDTVAMLDTPMPMVPTLTPMAGGTLARGLLMLSLRRMPLSSMADMDMLVTHLPIPMDTLATPTDMGLTPTLDKHLLKNTSKNSYLYK